MFGRGGGIGERGVSGSPFLFRVEGVKEGIEEQELERTLPLILSLAKGKLMTVHG